MEYSAKSKILHAIRITGFENQNRLKDMKDKQYRKYKEIYKIDINLLKELINDCSEFNDKTNLKMKWKGNKMEGGKLFFAEYSLSNSRRYS